MSRVCLDCEWLKQPNSGFAHFIVPLAHELIRQNQHYQFYCFTPPAAVGSLGHEGVRYLTQRSFHKYFNPHSYGLRLWHATTQLSWYVPTSPFTKVVLTVHDLNFLHEDPDGHTYARQLAMVRRNIKRADYLVTISDFVRQDILRHADLLGYRGRQPLRYVRRGVEALLPEPGHQPAYVPRRPFLFTVGTINEKKNQHVLPPLLAGNDYELVVAGSFAEPAYVAAMQQAAAEAGVADRLTVLTGISEADKTWYYEHCLAYLQPSKAEGFGLPVVEALQFGKPVFLSELTSLPEVGGAAAYYFPSFEPAAMQQALAAGLARHGPARATEARAQAAQFSWAQSAADYLAVYDELLRT
ncbi:MAG: glycosyltransferase family 4 protein [Janthinobacterium lividum]